MQIFCWYCKQVSSPPGWPALHSEAFNSAYGAHIWFSYNNGSTKHNILWSIVLWVHFINAKSYCHHFEITSWAGIENFPLISFIYKFGKRGDFIMSKHTTSRHLEVQTIRYFPLFYSSKKISQKQHQSRNTKLRQERL